MKNKIKYILFICLVAIQFNCKESFLDKGLLGELEETNFMQTESDAILATNAIYNERVVAIVCIRYTQAKIVCY